MNSQVRIVRVIRPRAAAFVATRRVRHAAGRPVALISALNEAPEAVQVGARWYVPAGPDEARFLDRMVEGVAL